MVRSLKRKRSSNIQVVSEETLKKRKPKSKELINNVMSQIFTQCGFVFPESNLDQNELSVDQTIFQKKVLTAIKNEKCNVDTIISGIEELWNDSLRFCFSVLPTHSNADCINSSRGQQQESLVRMLLGIKPLQVKFGCLLLEKLAEVSVDEDITKAATKIGDINLINLIVGQFKWLENLVGNMCLLDKVFEILTVCSNEIKEELISCIPDLCIDESHQEVASKLRELMLADSELVPCVLDALSNMNLKGDLLEDIRETVLKILPSAALKDLPSVIKFLQLSFDDTNGHETVLRIRENVNFSETLFPKDNLHSPTNKKLMTSKEKEAKIFDSLKTGIRFQKNVADTWMKIAEKIKSSDHFKIMDLYILFVLFAMKSRQKNVESLLRSKIKSGVITNEIVKTAFNAHPEVFCEFIKDIQHLAGTLLRSTEHIFSTFGGLMYERSFINFDIDCQKVIIETLVSHIGCGYTNEIHSALEVLQNLTGTTFDNMSSYLPQLKELLENAGKLNISHLRSLYKMISSLSMNIEFECDEIINIIKQELSSNFLRNKKISVVAAMMYFASLSKHLEETKGDLKQAIDVISLVKESINGQPELLCLFFDELSTIVSNETVNSRILSAISQSLVAEFQEEYLVDNDAVKSNLTPELEFAYDLDKQDEGGISVNIQPLTVNILHATEKNPSTMNSKNKLLSLPAHFRFVQIAESRENNGCLDGIDALLGCPLVLLKSRSSQSTEQLRNMSQEKQTSFCLSLIYAANWIREILNGFSVLFEQEDMKIKLISRLKHLNEIEKILSKSLPVCSHVELPVFDQRIDDDILAGIKSLKDMVEQTQFKKPKPKKKKTATSPNQTNAANATTANITEIEHDDDEGIDDDVNTIHEGVIDLSLFPASFREFGLTVFQLLNLYNPCEETADANKMSNEDVNLLLNDLRRKVAHAFNESARKSFLKQAATKLIGFSNLPPAHECVDKIIEIFPVMYRIYNTCQKYFQDLEKSSDGLRDSNLYQSDECKIYLEISNNLLQIFYTLFSWDGFKAMNQRENLKTCLYCLSSKGTMASPGKRPSRPLHKLAKSTVEYFASSIIPNIRGCVTLIKLLMTFATWCDKGVVNEIIEDKAKNSLQRNWFDRRGEKEKGAVFHSYLYYLIGVHLDMSRDPLELIDIICQRGVQEICDCNLSGDDSTSDYLTLSRNSLPAYCRGFYEKLVSYVKQEFNVTSKNKYQNNTWVEEKLCCGDKLIRVFQTLNKLAKEVENRILYASILKYSRLFFESFIRHVMPLLDHSFRSNKDKVSAILKCAQQSTRALQHLCGHTKFSKDLASTNHVPTLKKCLETFVFRVKAMLANNNCDQAFWMGNLKHRDLKGNEILSQVESTDACSNQGEESENSVVEESADVLDEEYSESY